MEDQIMLKSLFEGFGLNDEEAEITSWNCVMGNRKMPKAIGKRLKKYISLF